MLFSLNLKEEILDFRASFSITIIPVFTARWAGEWMRGPTSTVLVAKLRKCRIAGVSKVFLALGFYFFDFMVSHRQRDAGVHYRSVRVGVISWAWDAIARIMILRCVGCRYLCQIGDFAAMLRITGAVPVLSKVTGS